jgi:DNA helicase II / ATP-dependent DNA helicase PcrA
VAASRRPALASPSDEQLRAILAPEGPLLVLAGPGSGKTNTLADRIGYLVRVLRVPPHRVLAFSFTRVAAATLRDRLALRLGRDAAAVAVTTFHSFGRRITERWAVDLGYDGPRLRVLSREDARSLLAEAFGALAGEPPPDLALETIEEAVFRVRLGEMPSADDALALALAEAYEGALRERRALDYTAMLALPLRLFAHRPEILRRYRDAYRHILVDEYQDVNLAQYRLARLLAGGHDCLTVVGDPAQTIYSFAGASARFLLDFPREYPGATVAALTRNYRSTGHIVEATNVVALPLPYGRPLWTANDAGPPPILRAADDPADEAAYVAAEIRRLLDRRLVAGPAGIAVLSRNNDQFPAIARALAARHIPHGDRRATGDRVRLATVHAAKGDEWIAVFVTGLEEGLLPDRRAVRAGDDAALVAERHLAYVAVSRPRERLYLTYCTRRPLSGDTATSEPLAPSRFLVALPVVAASGSRRREASGKEAA